MQSLVGTKTGKNLKEAFTKTSEVHVLYLYFAQKADIEGYHDISAVFRSTAEGVAGHAHGHLDFLAEVGDPVTGKAIGNTADNLKAAIASETCDYTDMYPHKSRTAQRGVRRDRRLVRDPGEGGEEARRALPEGARHARFVLPPYN